MFRLYGFGLVIACAAATPCLGQSIQLQNTRVDTGATVSPMLPGCGVVPAVDTGIILVPDMFGEIEFDCGDSEAQAFGITNTVGLLPNILYRTVAGASAAADRNQALEFGGSSAGVTNGVLVMSPVLVSIDFDLTTSMLLSDCGSPSGAAISLEVSTRAGSTFYEIEVDTDPMNTSQLLPQAIFLDVGEYDILAEAGQSCTFEDNSEDTSIATLVYNLRIINDCPADLTTDGTANGIPDGMVTLSDFTFYLSIWTAGNLSADVTTTGSGSGVPDGVVDLSDFNFFLNLWSGSQGACP
ncbi:MAG: GC-type dockerin domain-anchored protein [Planctomycetota bacterium]